MIRYLIVLSVLVGPVFNSPRIYGGTMIPIKEAPYQAAIFHNNNFTCGGALIYKNFVITAAHCAPCYKEKCNGKGYTVLLGNNNLKNKNTQKIKVMSIIPHPMAYRTPGSLEIINTKTRSGSRKSFFDDLFNPNNFDESELFEVILNVTDSDSVQNDEDVNMNFDLAILKLKRVKDWPKNAKPVKLPDDGEKVSEGDLLVVSGWGKTEDQILPKFLKQTLGTAHNQKECREFYSNQKNVRINKTMGCVGAIDEGSHPCDGDVGGPVVGIIDEKLHGISILSSECKRSKNPQLYVKIEPFLKWISKTIKSRQKKSSA